MVASHQWCTSGIFTDYLDHGIESAVSKLMADTMLDSNKMAEILPVANTLKGEEKRREEKRREEKKRREKRREEREEKRREEKRREKREERREEEKNIWHIVL
ncbi:hypothetical protein DUI87_25347 [Hirundo rustica rustica]|uniref:Uncharacterized protein n=1 Tax=Hirundo rustica rustica TaxID=333673 RepID=A0A3M0JGK6_HIRRU|nr:hypothetical protein DUI87_25347 [Hirundo rustica rustica]